MSEFIDKLKELYEEKKDLKNPPSYIYTIEQILKIDSTLKKESENSNHEKLQT